MTKALLIPVEECLLTYEEAANYMRVSKVFIWKRRKEGLLKSISAGRKVLFQRSAIDEYLKINNSSIHQIEKEAV